jgi:hypothetical protein
MNPMGCGTKNDCGGDGHQQFTPTRSERTTPRAVIRINMIESPKGPGTKIYCTGEDQKQFMRNLIHANEQSHDAVLDV